jgi:outer membrane lipoprotein-sorting protein
MRIAVIVSVICILVVSACSASASVEAAPGIESTTASIQPAGAMESSAETAQPAPAPAAPNPALDSLLAQMDRRTTEIKTLSADITITTQEAIPGGRKSVRIGKLYIRRPNDLYLDLRENSYPRKIWISADAIVDYSPDLNSAIKVELPRDAAGRPAIIGLSTTSKELREDFDMTAEAPTPTHPNTYTLTLTPKVGRRFRDFTSAAVTLDAHSLFPSRIVQKNADTGIDKIYDISAIDENPRLPAKTFEPNLSSKASVETYTMEKWKGL